MIEITVLNYLHDKLDVPVHTEKQSDVKEYVLIRKAGSGREDLIDNSTIIIQSYSSTLYSAAVLNEKVKIAMLGNGTDTYGIIELDNVSKCSLNSDYEYSDLTQKEYRYQAVYDLVY